MSKTIALAETPAEKIRFNVHWLQVFVMAGRGEEAESMVQKLLDVADELETTNQRENA